MSLIKRAGILILLLCMTITVFPQETESGPRILIRKSSDYPTAGSTWVLTLLINHHEPGEVNVMAPNFTGSLLLDQVVKVPRYLNAATGQFMNSRPAPDESTNAGTNTNVNIRAAVPEQWTAMEYRFILTNPGMIHFDSFTVTTPQGETKTGPFQLSVQRQRGTDSVQHLRFTWESIPAGLAVGDSAVFGLRAIEPKAIHSLPEPDVFMPSVPPGHILELTALSEQEKSEGMALKLRLVPLEAVPFTLDRRQFTRDGAIFEIPALRIPVSRAGGKMTLPSNQPIAPDTEQRGMAPVFPALETAANAYPGLYTQHRAECETLYTTARNLWDRGYYAQTLALLRKNERDHQAGRFFAVFRREAERTLGFTGTHDEKSGLMGWPWGKNSRAAVLKETAVRRIPDMAGEETVRFREGRPVLLPKGASPEQPNAVWVRVIANDAEGISGWVLWENVIVY